jgi:hypothetical protein
MLCGYCRVVSGGNVKYPAHSTGAHYEEVRLLYPVWFVLLDSYLFGRWSQQKDAW